MTLGTMRTGWQFPRRADHDKITLTVEGMRLCRKSWQRHDADSRGAGFWPARQCARLKRPIKTASAAVPQPPLPLDRYGLDVRIRTMRISMKIAQVASMESVPPPLPGGAARPLELQGVP